MLTHLSIRNYVLIEALEISPSAQFNIVTGETGAGKSIMLGAIGLLLGNRADTRSLLNDSEKCIIEGSFDISEYHLDQWFESEELDYDPNTIIRREITPSGKSRAFINDTPVTLDILKKIGSFLIDIHSQHDQLLLGSHHFQLSLVDNFAGHFELLEQYKQAFLSYTEANSHYERLVKESIELAKEADYHKFQLEELKSANLSAHEQEELEESLKMMENAEEIMTLLNYSFQSLSESEQCINDHLQEVLASIRQLATISQKYETLANRTESTLIELKDIAQELNNEQGNIEFDPEKIVQTKDRLNLIYRLQQKHHLNNIKDLLLLQSELSDKVNKTAHLEDDIKTALAQKEVLFEKMISVGSTLSNARKMEFGKITTAISTLLADLGMPNASLEILSKNIEPNAYGTDEINLLFSANKGIAPQTLKNVASGGEFARLMFCIKFIIADKVALPTIIFDEIDTGISGEISIKMADMMKVMAENHQVIAISHLPQLAAKGDAHFFVYKDNSFEKAISKIKTLDGEERIEEIAKMIGGDQPTSAAFENARQLIGV